MVCPLRAQPDTGTIIEPESSSWPLLLRHLQPFAPPDPLHSVPAHLPSRALQHRRDFLIPIAAILACQGDYRRCQLILDGIGRADSITIDAHKWFAATMGAGMFLTARPEVPAQVFRIDTSYMPTGATGKDFYVNSNQWSRRFVCLRLFLALGTAGWDGYARHVEHSIRLTSRLAGHLQRNGWSLLNASPMAVACLVPPEGHDAVWHYVDAVLEDGRFWLSQAVFEGKSVLRVCVTNGRTRERGIDALAEFLASVSVRSRRSNRSERA